MSKKKKIIIITVSILSVLLIGAGITLAIIFLRCGAPEPSVNVPRSYIYGDFEYTVSSDKEI